jgi:hypothetical protein
MPVQLVVSPTTAQDGDVLIAIRDGKPANLVLPFAVKMLQETSSATWVFTHDLARQPAVSVYLSTGEQVITEVHSTTTTVTVYFAVATTGYVILA